VSLPEPLTPADCDLRDFPRMMIDISRLRQSAFDATPDDSAWRAGLNLWFSAWHSVPAGSLDNDEAGLTKAAGLGRDIRTWRKVRAAALRGFTVCADGRLYHETVCELALEAWIEKLVQRLSSGAGNAKRWGGSFDPAQIEAAIDHAVGLLAAIAPHSKSIQKARRRHSKPDAGGTGKQSRRDDETIPTGSQGTGEGTGTGIIREGSDDPSLSGESAKASPKRLAEATIPEGFPDGAALAAAEAWVKDAASTVDVTAHAKRFRNHALAHQRKVADWGAAWRGWIDIEIEKAPKREQDTQVAEFTWDGPAEVWDAVCAAKSPAWAQCHLGNCAARGLTLYTASPTTEKRLREDVGRLLADIGVTLIRGAPPKAKGRAA
jgi:hypothetical protein